MDAMKMIIILIVVNSLLLGMQVMSSGEFAIDGINTTAYNIKVAMEDNEIVKENNPDTYQSETSEGSQRDTGKIGILDLLKLGLNPNPYPSDHYENNVQKYLADLIKYMRYILLIISIILTYYVIFNKKVD